MSVVGVPMLLGPILGPVIGGVIVDSVVVAVDLLRQRADRHRRARAGSRLLKADAGRADAGRLDWLGLALLSPGLAGIVFGLSESESHGGFGDPLVWVPIVVGAVLVALFVLHAWRAPRPLIDVRLFRDRVFAAAATTTFLVGGALFGAMIILPLYYQVARGESALTAGLLMAPQGIGAAMAMPVAGRLTDKLGGGRVAVVGLLILTVGTIPFAFLESDTSYTLLALLLVLRGIGIGSSMMPAMAAAYATLESSAVPRATSALNVMQRVGGSLGTALLAVVLQGEISDRLPEGRRRRRGARSSGCPTPCARGSPSRWPTRSRPRSGGRSACRCWR